MGSLEDLFEREEIGFHSYNDIVDYLSGDGRRKRSSYRNAAIILSEPLGIREELGTTDDFDALRSLRNQAQTIPMSNARRDLVADIESKMSTVAKELTKISEERAEIRLEEKQLERTKLRLEKQLDTITDNVSDSTLGELSRMEGKLNQMEELDIDTSTARGLISERISEIEEEKELRITQQITARERKISLREQGFEPDF